MYILYTQKCKSNASQFNAFLDFDWYACEFFCVLQTMILQSEKNAVPGKLWEFIFNHENPKASGTLLT